MTTADNATKFVWAYMLENGVLTTGEWRYYGGCWSAKNPKLEFDYEGQEKERKQFLKRVSSTGIDWNKTKSVTSRTQSSFEGTFVDSSSVESIIGTLVLKDGTEHMVGVNNAEKRFSDYMKTLAELMQDKERVKKILGEELIV